MDILQQLKQDGISKNMCRNGQIEFEKCLNIKQLSALFFKDIDFCIGHDFPTLDFFRNNFKGLCEPYGIYIDDNVEINNQRNIALNGNCSALLEYDVCGVYQVYIRHTSQVSIVADAYTHIVIDIFDDAYLAISTVGEHSQADVNVHSKRAVIECLGGNVKINNK